MEDDIFAGVGYYITLTLPTDTRDQFSQVLDEGGAVAVALDDPSLTHFITTSLPDRDSLEVLPDGSKARLVTPTWVERSRILGSIQPPEYYTPDPAHLFSGVTASAVDLSQSDLELLSAAITALGGQWRVTLTRDVTHLFALAPGSQMYEIAMHFRDKTGMVVILPHWFDDSVRLGVKGLPTAEYEWPEPAVLKLHAGEDGNDTLKSHRIPKGKKAFFETAVADGADLPARRARSRNIWKGMKVLLSASLGFNERQRAAHEADVRREGGNVVQLELLELGSPEEIAKEEAEKVGEADVLVTKYRSGPAYVKAFKANKTIGTLSWLWYCRASGHLSRPTDQLLHYPIPRKPIEGFSSHIITITNYTGRHRDYLKKLIMTMGAQFTPSMSPKNTVVIAAFISGTKTEKAQSWSIPVVNHTWLEDCFAHWRALTPAQTRYITFPPGVDYSQTLAEPRAAGKVTYDPAELEALAVEGVGEEEEQAEGLEGTANSAREAREVEEAVMMTDEVVGDVSMGGYLEQELRVEEQDAMDVDGEQRKEDAVSAKKKQAAVHATNAQKEERQVVPVKGLEVEDEKMGSRQAVSTRRQVKAANARRMSDDERPSAVAGHQKSSTASRRKSGPAAPAEDEDERGTSEVRGPSMRSRMKAKGAAKAESTDRDKSSRAARHAEVEEDEDDEDEPDLRPPTRSSKLAAAVKASRTAPPLTSDDAPAESPRKSTRRVSVVVPTVAAVYSSQPSAPNSPQKSTARAESEHAEAREASRQSARKVTHESTSAAPTNSQSARAGRFSARTAQKDGQDDAPAESVASPSMLDTSASTRMSSRRSAATKASQRLKNEIMPDVMNFQKEMKRGHVKPAWESEQASEEGKGKSKGKDADARGGKGKKRASFAHEDEQEEDDIVPEKKKVRLSAGSQKQKGTRQRRTSTQKEKAQDDSDVGEDDGEFTRWKPLTTGKKASSSYTSNKPIHIMTTQIAVSDEVVRALTKLGAKMTTKPAECTHLVVKSLVRTEKFLCAMAVAPYILNEKWLLASAASKHLLPEKDYLLVDPASESKYGFKLSDALLRAKRNNGRLFAGMTFYATPKVPVDTKLLKNVVMASGGQLLTQTPTLRILNGHDDRYIISTPADISTWRPLAENGYPIYSHELILNAALHQEIDWESPSSRVSSEK